MIPNLLCLIPLTAAFMGCATSGLPQGTRLVGVGLLVSSDVRTNGAAILIERTSRQIVAIESLSKNGTFKSGQGEPS